MHDRARIFLLVSGCLCVSAVHAGTDYCDQTISDKSIELMATDVDRQSLQSGSSSSVAVSRSQMTLGWLLNGDESLIRSIGLGWQYTIIDFQSLDAMTNGHLHRWSVPLQGQTEHDDASLHYQLIPALSVSSNALKNPGLWNKNSVQLNAGAIYKKRFSTHSNWLLGVRSDHRFGHYKGYPVVGLCLRSGRDWRMQLAYPDTRITRQVGQSWSVSVYSGPVGDQWHVFSKDESQQSDFSYHARATGLSILWQADDRMSFSLQLEKQGSRQFNFLLDDLSVVDSRAESTTGLRISGRVWF